MRFAAMGATAVLLLGLTLVPLERSMAESSGLFSHAGLRIGINDDENEEDFTQVQLFGVIPLPAKAESESWFIDVVLQGTIATLHAANKTGLVFTLGPGIEFGPKAIPLTFSAGLNPSVATRSDYGDEDLGGWFYFTSYVGFNYRIAQHLGLGFQVSHMSNAGINDRNPGVNIFSLELNYRF